MTTLRLVDALGGVDGRLWQQLALAALVTLLLPITITIDTALLGWRLLRGGAESRQGACAGGHRVELVGVWTCPSCGLVAEGRAWAPCTHCGEIAYAVLCPCGLPVVNPHATGSR